MSVHLPKPKIPDPLFRIPELALALDCSVETIRRRIARGEIKVVRLSARAIRVRKSEIMRLISAGSNP